MPENGNHPSPSKTEKPAGSSKKEMLGKVFLKKEACKTLASVKGGPES